MHVPSTSFKRLMITAIHFINVLASLPARTLDLVMLTKETMFFCLFRGFVTDQLIAVWASLRSALGSADLILFGLAMS